MLRLTMRDGEVFEGDTHLDLVRAMKGASMFSDAKGVLDYIETVQRRLQQTEGIELAVAGEEIDERCEALVLELTRNDLATLERSLGAELDETERMIRQTARLLNAGDLAGAWAFLRPRMRLPEEELAELDRRLGLTGRKET